MPRPNYVPAVIPSGGTKPITFTKLVGQQIIGIITPSTFVSTAITFNMCPDLNAAIVLSLPVKDSSGSAVSFTVTTSGYYGFSQDQIAKLSGVENIQPVCGSAETTGATLQLVLIPRPSI